MSADLERRMRAARERWIDAAGARVKVRRPLDLELADIMSQSEVSRLARRVAERHEDDADVRALLREVDKSAHTAIVLRYVVDWEVTEADLLPGVGGEDRADFSAAAWREYVLGRPALFNEVLASVMGWFTEHKSALEAVPGKSASS